MRLKDYIQGNRSGKDANRIEREAMNDPFLQEALDGFDAVAGDHAPTIERLEKRYTKPVSKNRYKTLLWYGSIAASILLLVGISHFFIKQKAEMETKTIAMLENNENEEIIHDNDHLLSQQVHHEMVVENVSVRQEPIEERQQKERVSQKTQTTTSKVKELFEVSETYTDIVAEDVVHEVIVADKVVAADIVEVSYEPLNNSNNLFVEASSKQIIKNEQIIPAMSVVKDPYKVILPTVHGKIIDEIGKPIPGVTIFEKGTRTGTVTDIKGSFALQVATDSSTLITSFIGYEPQEIKSFGEEQTVILKPSEMKLSEVVVVGYGSQRRRSVTGAAPNFSAREAVSRPFGEKEFQIYCQQNGDKNICGEDDISIKVSFYIDKTGKPTKISYEKYSCEDAKKEMEKLLSSSPTWTQTNREVTLTIEW